METIKMEDKDGNIKEYEVVVSFYSNKNFNIFCFIKQYIF